MDAQSILGLAVERPTKNVSPNAKGLTEVRPSESERPEPQRNKFSQNYCCGFRPKNQSLDLLGGMASIITPAYLQPAKTGAASLIHWFLNSLPAARS